MPHPSAPRIILVASVPRSGSTWVFNAARRLLEETGRPLHAAWVGDYDPAHPAPDHLVKAHQVAEVTFRPDIVLTTRRAPQDCLASLIRMGWLKDDAAAIRRAWAHHHRLQAHWQAQSDLEIAYDEITAAPETALTRLAGGLRVDLSAGTPARIAAELAALTAPETGRYDPETLLHPGHRGEAGTDTPGPDHILRIVGDG